MSGSAFHRRNQKQKRYERNCKNIHPPAHSERGTKILAFPLTLLIMDVRKDYTAMGEDFCADVRSRRVSFESRFDTSALKLLPLRQIIELFSEASKVARAKRYQPEDAQDLSPIE